MTTLAQLGENRFLARLLKNLPTGRDVVIGVGDDCAVVRRGGAYELLKTDCIVEDVHFLPDTPPRLVGRKALARALSDIAAMGGTPCEALVTIFSPPECSAQYWYEVYRGLCALAKKHSVSIVGGETSRAPMRAISVTLTGTTQHVVPRNGGLTGDILYVTGCLGGSIARHHLTFTPRLAEGQWLAQKGYARAMMDLSDGLLADAPRLATASRCGFTLDYTAVPCRRGCNIEAALGDGEDYELLFAVPFNRAARLEKEWPFPRTRLTAIGRLCEENTSHQKAGGGYEHFRGKRI